MSTHPRHRLDEVIHAPVRFSIMATLAAVDKAEFSFVRDTVEVSGSVLSRQVSTLEAAGYVKVTKGYVGKRPRTWLSLTRDGREASIAHVGALQVARMRRIRVALAMVVTVAVLVTVLGCSAAVSPTADNAGQASPLMTLIDVAAQRVQLADTVAAAKWGTDAPIDDPVRENAVLDAVAAKSAQLDIDPKASRAVFTDQIEANKIVQYGLYSRWRAYPDRAPTTRPDLSQVRPILDRITDQLLAELKATQQFRVNPSCTAQLTGARNRVERARHLDPLHEDAFARALTSICR
jgi:chorismate mutase